MKTSRIIFIAALALCAGCTKNTLPQSPARAPENAPKAQPTASASAPAPVPPADAAAVPANTDVPKDLEPIQTGIEAFTKANNRLPNNVEELVEKKFITKLPPLPTGQIYYIDHATGRIKVGGGP